MVRLIPGVQGDIFEDSNNQYQVLYLGNADSHSFRSHREEYNKTLEEMNTIFKETYLSFIRIIRALAYPPKPTMVFGQARDTYPEIPIHVISPVCGELHQETESVVNQLRAEGDKSVFYVSTAGWLNPDTDQAENRDFFFDGSNPSSSSQVMPNVYLQKIVHRNLCD
jgi:hypothetical protein